MRQVAQHGRGPVPVSLKNSIESFGLSLGELLGIASHGAYREHSLVGIVERGAHGAVGPGFNAVGEQRLLIPDKRPRLSVVDEFLELHGGHLTLLLKDVLRCVENGGHYDFVGMMMEFGTSLP